MSISTTAKPSAKLTDDVVAFSVGFRYADIPEPAVALSRRCIIDALGVAMAGSEQPAADAVERFLAHFDSRGGSRRIGEAGRRFPAPLAALWNGVCGHAMDWDDTQLASGPGRIYGLLTHPTVPPLAALFALADGDQPVDGRRFLTAFHAGFEVECKIAEAINPNHYGKGFHSSGTIGTFGAAVASAKFLNLGEEATRHTIGIAASMASGIRANFGTMTKPLHVGRAAENGVTAALLAAQGFTADRQALDGQWGYLEVAGQGAPDLDLAVGRLGRPFSILEPGVSIKPYPCGVLTHPSMDAVRRLMLRHGLEHQAITAIRLYAGSNILNPIRYPVARTELEAKFCMPFLLAAIAITGKAGKHQFTDAFVASPASQDMQRRVSVVLDPDIEALGYERIRSRIEVDTADGRQLVEWADENYRGGPDNPFTDAEVEEKFNDCVDGLIAPPKQRQVLDRLWQFDQLDDVRVVLDLLHWRSVAKATSHRLAAAT